MSSPNGMGHYHHHHHYLSQQLDSRAVTKLLHPRPSLASLWVVPQLWFMFFILLPQFFAKLSSVDHTSTFPPGSSGLQLWWQNWHPCTARAQSSAIISWSWRSSYSLAGTVLRGHGSRQFLAKRCVGFSWGLLCERTTAWQGHVRSSGSVLIHTEQLTIHSSGRASAQSWCCTVMTFRLHSDSLRCSWLCSVFSECPHWYLHPVWECCQDRLRSLCWENGMGTSRNSFKLFENSALTKVREPLLTGKVSQTLW